MAENTQPSENDPTPDPENEANQAPTGTGNDAWKDRALKAEKEAETIVQERNLLRKQLNDVKEENSKSIEKVLKEKEDALGELETLKKESETTKKQQAIAAKKADLLKEYPDTVRQLAEDLDVDLTDPDDEKAIEIFTTKLDKIKDRVDAEGGSGEETSPKPKSKPKVGSDNSNLETREQRQKTETEDMAELTKRVENITF